MAGRGGKRNGVRDSVVVVTCTMGTFSLLVFKFIFGSFGALVSKGAVTRKRLAVQVNGVKFGTCS